jgi:hypothetical protein
LSIEKRRRAMLGLFVGTGVSLTPLPVLLVAVAAGMFAVQLGWLAVRPYASLIVMFVLGWLLALILCLAVAGCTGVGAGYLPAQEDQTTSARSGDNGGSSYYESVNLRLQKRFTNVPERSVAVEGVGRHVSVAPDKPVLRLPETEILGAVPLTRKLCRLR